MIDLIYKESFDLFLGKKIASGVSRTVYESSFDSKTVIKVEEPGTHINALEYYIWDTVSQNDKISKYFAKVIALSPNGRILIMERVWFPPHVQYPKQMPSFFTDLKYSNYGFISDQIKCCDYGSLLLEKGLNLRMRKANWWEL